MRINYLAALVTIVLSLSAGCGSGGEEGSGAPETANAAFTIVNDGDAFEVIDYMSITRVENGQPQPQPVFTRDTDLWPDRQVTVPVNGGVYRFAVDWTCPGDTCVDDDVFDLVLVSGEWIVKVWPGGHSTD